MGWLTELLRSIAPPATGIEVDEPDPIPVPVGASPGAFIRAIGVLVDPGAVLYWEGRASPVLNAWLDRLTLEPRPAVSVGITPVADFHHVPLDSGVLDELAQRVDRPGAIGRRIRLHVRQCDRIILQWRRGFSREPVLLSRSLDPHRIHAFEALVRARPTPSR